MSSDTCFQSPLPIIEGSVSRLPKNYVPREWHEQAMGGFLRGLNLVQANEQYRYFLYAGTGSGKTNFAAHVASRLLALKVIDFVVYVSPNRLICDKVVEVFKHWGIYFPDKKKPGETRSPLEIANLDGHVMTYQALTPARVEQLRRLCAHKSVLVIFDEAHHLGDSQAWATAALAAFEDDARVVLSMSGTPYRTDRLQICFAPYDQQVNGLFRPRFDFTYSLGRSILDNHCRQPVFRWSDATGFERGADGEVLRTYRFSDKNIDERDSNLLLNQSVAVGSSRIFEFGNQGSSWRGPACHRFCRWRHHVANHRL